MIELSLFGLLGLFIWILFGWGGRLQDLEEKVKSLERLQEKTWLLLVSTLEDARSDHTTEHTTEHTTDHATEVPPELARPPAPPVPPEPPPPLPSPSQPIAPPAPNPNWVRLCTLWSDNWTGILGVAAVVAGATFLVINVALRRDPDQRRDAEGAPQRS